MWSRVNKSEDELNKIYTDINEKDLIYCKIDRDLLNDIILKMSQICDYYWDNVSVKYFELVNASEDGIKRNRRMFENNLLCYRILNNKTCPEPSTRTTVLSILASVYAFMLQIEKAQGAAPGGLDQNIFCDSNFCNTIGICSVFEWKTKTIKDKALIEFYKCCGIDDGQPFTSKHWFFNNPDLLDRMYDFLRFDIDDYMRKGLCPGC